MDDNETHDFNEKLAKMNVGEEIYIADTIIRCDLWESGTSCNHCVRGSVKGCGGCRSITRDDGLKVKYVDIEAESYWKHQCFVAQKKYELKRGNNKTD